MDIIERTSHKIRSKISIMENAFYVSDVHKIDFFELPNLLREVADDIQNEINRQKEK